LLIVFQQCDFDFAGNWHAEAVEEYEEEEEVTQCDTKTEKTHDHVPIRWPVKVACVSRFVGQLCRQSWPTYTGYCQRSRTSYDMLGISL